MYETESELGELDALLDRSLSGATEHLRSIIQPGARTLTARQMSSVPSGMCLLALSTVTSRGEPRVSAVDGHFLHGHWVFSTERASAKARQLQRNPAISAAHLRGEEVGIFTHGIAEVLNPAGGPAEPEFDAVLAHMTEHYGESPLGWGDIVAVRLRPAWMVAFASDPQQLLSADAS